MIAKANPERRENMKQELRKEANLFCLAALAWATQQAGTHRNGAMAPEETPPNEERAAKTAQVIPRKEPPWNEWLRLARQGDEQAKLRFFTQAEPFIKRLCNTRYFGDRLGMDEIRSTATLALLEFLMNYPNPPADTNLPFLLKRIMHNRVLMQIKKQKVTQQRKCSITGQEDNRQAETGQDSIKNVPANRKEEPEAKLLAKELHNATEEAMQQLLPNEQNVIRALFFQNKTMAGFARELQCTRQNVEQMRDRAFHRLRQFFEGQGFNSGAFCN